MQRHVAIGRAVARGETRDDAAFAVLQAAMMFCFGMVAANFASIAIELLRDVTGAGSSIFGTLALVLVTERRMLFGGRRAATAEG